MVKKGDMIIRHKTCNRLISRDQTDMTVCRALLFLVFSVYFFIPSTCFSQSISTDPPPPEDVTLQLKWKHQFQFAGYYAALEKGYYQRAGLNVTIIEAKDGEDTAEAVINGKADFGIAMSDLIYLRGKGHPVVALASIYQHSPLILLVPETTGIDNIHELKGRRVSLEANSEELFAYFDSEGISPGKMILYPHEYNISNLIAGEVDAITAYSTDEPFILFQKGIKYYTFSPRASGIDFYGDTLFTTEAQIKKNPERVAAFLDASLKGWQYAIDHSDEIIDLILNKYSKRHSRGHLLFEAEKSKKLIMADVVELGYINHGRWQNIVDIFKRHNQVPEDFSLKGFIFDRTPLADFRWLYISFSVVSIAALVAFLISGRFYRLNRSLNDEIIRRQTVENNLKISERNISTLLSNLPGMAYRCLNDSTYTMKFVSQGCEGVTGYAPEDLIDNTVIAYSHLIHPEDLEKVQKDVHSAVSEHRPFVLFYRIINKQDSIRWIWEQGRGIYSSNGDLDFLDGLIADISEQKEVEHEREELIIKLQDAVKEIKTLSGLLPICAHCKNIKDDHGYWKQIETYIQEHSEARFSHGICRDCAEKHYPDMDLYKDE